MISAEALCQRRSNPFEIIPRLDSVRQHDESSSNTQDFIPMDNDTLSKITFDEKTDGISVDSDENELTRTSSLLTDPKYNPFEVDHVPIRKNRLSEQAKKVDFGTAIVSSTAKTNNFLIWLLMISAALLAIVVSGRRNIFGVIYRSVFNENMLKLFHREESQKPSSHIILLYAIYAINACTFTYLSVSGNSTIKGLKLWSAILLLVIIVYAIRHLSLSVLGYLFRIEKSTGLYSFTVMLINFAIGLMLIPFNLLIAFGPDKISAIMFYTALTMICMLVVMRAIRGIFIAAQFVNERLFQIIIYLCAFEIAPVLILVKTAVKILH
jgi:hypothetical protein